MTETEFNKYQDVFKKYISDRDLDERTNFIDGESTLSRIEKSGLNEVMDSNIIVHLLMFNYHLLNEEYESAIIMKNIILKDL